VGFSEGLRAELAKDGIVVTTVCPGLMRTGIPRNAKFKGQHRAELIDTLPARLGARFHGVFPGLTADLLGPVNRLLPRPGGIGSRTAIIRVFLGNSRRSPLRFGSEATAATFLPGVPRLLTAVTSLVGQLYKLFLDGP